MSSYGSGFITLCLPSREQHSMDLMEEITRNQQLHRTTMDHRKAPQEECLRSNIQITSPRLQTSSPTTITA
ncbi:hypothetical protein DAI22_08g126300 [Oryza sativa Japonica Group]|nr:hypothetical protein DAI22_08g126300 [Oryza sativa Japonica Group]